MAILITLLIFQIIFQAWLLSLMICLKCDIRPEEKEGLTLPGKIARAMAYNILLLKRNGGKRKNAETHTRRKAKEPSWKKTQEKN